MSEEILPANVTFCNAEPINYHFFSLSPRSWTATLRLTVKKQIHIKKGIKCLTFDIIGTVFDFYGSLSVSLKPLAKQYSLKIDAKAYALKWVDGYANASWQSTPERNPRQRRITF